VSVSESRIGHDQLAELAAELERKVDEILSVVGSPLEVSESSLRRIVTAAARLHARYAESAGRVDPLREDVSPTEAVDLACGLLRSRDLNPFDLALWFSRPS
jgi:hypothetical protein